MSVIKILGVDPGVRNLGFGVINYNDENNDISISNCGVLKTPVKFKGNDAILYMKNELKELFATNVFDDVDKVVIEIPRSSFGGKFQSWALIPIGVVGGLVMGFFEVDKLILCTPSEWNRCKKKEKTHAELEGKYGSPDDWHFIYEPTNKVHREHILDAVGIASWHLNSEYIRS